MDGKRHIARLRMTGDELVNRYTEFKESTIDYLTVDAPSFDMSFIPKFAALKVRHLKLTDANFTAAATFVFAESIGHLESLRLDAASTIIMTPVAAMIEKQFAARQTVQPAGDMRIWQAAAVGSVVQWDALEGLPDADLYGLHAVGFARHWRKCEPSLQREAARYTARLQIEELIKGLNRNTRRAAQRLFEQWYIMRANAKPADLWLNGELVKLGYPSLIDKIRDAAQEMALGYVAKCAYKTTYDTIKLYFGRDGDLKFVAQISLDRYKVLVPWNDVEKKKQFTIMMLRYAATFSDKRQFATNLSIVQSAVDAGVTIEGFASPFNAQILLTNHNGVAQFCSMYPDVDAPFGALGSFFLQNMRELKCFLNPPSNETMLTDVDVFVHKQLAAAPCEFHILLPRWEDFLPWDNMMRSKWVKSVSSVKAPSVDPFTGELFPSTKKFDLVVLSSY